MGKHIFISYTKKDKNFAEKLANDLISFGHQVWYDRSLEAGEEWEPKIEEELKAAQEIIVIISPNGLESRWVQHECSIAYALQKPIYPVLIEDIGKQSLPVGVGKYQLHDFIEDEYSVALEKLKHILIPPNPVQQLLDMQVVAFRETQALLDRPILEVIEGAMPNLDVSDEAGKLIRLSREAIKNAGRRSRTRWIVTAMIVVAAIVVSALGVSGALNPYIFKPVDMGDYWVEIPAGSFVMGGEEEGAMKSHTVFLDSYLIGRYEVTNRQYAQCVKAGICLESKFPGTETESEQPVTFVTWNDAQTYCAWVGGRLPTEAEWEKAARGGLEGKLYPWGDQFPVCNPGAENGAALDSCSNGPFDVGSFSPNGYGLYDMIGGVWEHVADYFQSDYYYNSPTKNPTGPENGQFGILRGGIVGTDELTVYHRNPIYREDTSLGVGVRCAQDAP